MPNRAKDLMYSFLRKYSINVTGTLATQLVNSLGFLTVAAICSPLIIGTFASILACSYITSIFFTLRIEILAFYADNEVSEKIYFHMASRYIFQASAGFFTLFLVTIFFLKVFETAELPQVSKAVLIILEIFSISACLAGLSLITTVFNKRGQFSELAKVRFVVAIMTILSQLILCVENASHEKLALGVVIGSVSAVLLLKETRNLVLMFTITREKVIAPAQWKFRLSDSVVQLIGIALIQLPIIITSALYGAEFGGYFEVAQRFSQLPLSVLATAITKLTGDSS